MLLKKKKVIFYLVVCSFLIAGCGPGQIFGLTPTPTLIPTPTPIPSPTPLPGGIVIGNVSLTNRGEPVQTTIYLMLQEENEEVDRIDTDNEGNYAFLSIEPGTYYVSVSIFDLLESCKDLKSFSTNTMDWKMMTQIYDGSGMTDARIISAPIQVEIGEEIIKDCELICE
jgi:hypothetical protein